jgi:hypothetical protein
MEADEPAFFSAAVVVPSARIEARDDRITMEAEPAAPATSPQFAELAEEPVYTPLPRDYASDFGNGVRGPAKTEEPAKSGTDPYAAPGEEAERDLDVPAFMRRLKF